MGNAVNQVPVGFCVAGENGDITGELSEQGRIWVAEQGLDG